MATINKVPLICVGTLHGGPPLVATYPEAASQVFLKGEAVYLDGSGNVAEYTLALDDGTQRFVGFAAEDGHNDSVAATHNVQVYLAFGNIFEANATSNGNDQATVRTQVGSAYVLYEDATNNRVAIDIANTGGQISACRILNLSPKDTVGDTNGRLLFTILSAAVQVSGAGT